MGMRSILSACLVLFTASTTFSETSLISGKVTDLKGLGLGGVEVSYEQENYGNHFATTDVDGNWRIQPKSTVSNRIPPADRIAWNNGALEISVSGRGGFAWDVYDLRGVSVGGRKEMFLESGVHRIPLDLGTGLFWIRVTGNGHSQILRVGGVGHSLGGSPAVVGVASAVSQRSQFSMVGKVKFFRKEKNVATISLEILDTSHFLVKLDTSKSDSFPWNGAVGTLYDKRDGQIYRTTLIGRNRWMAENLNFKIDSSWLANSYDWSFHATSWIRVDENKTNGSRYGRYYTWVGAMDLPVSCTDSACSYSLPRRGICPEGWHIPSNQEWQDLRATVEASPGVGKGKAGHALIASRGWPQEETELVTDRFGFRALPAGSFDAPEGLGRGQAFFFSSTAFAPGAAYYSLITYAYPLLQELQYYTSSMKYSVRCVQ